jgi:hypothetical protein
MVAPAVVRLANRVGRARLLALFTLAGLVLPIWMEGVFASLNHQTALALRVLTLTGVGVWCLALAHWARRIDLTVSAAVLSVLAMVLMVIEQVQPLPLLPWAVSRFGMFVGIGLLLTVLPLPSLVGRGLTLLGRNALLVFIAHRLVMHLFAWRLADSSSMTPDTQSTVLTAATLAAMLAMCVVREALPSRFASLAKTVGF